MDEPLTHEPVPGEEAPERTQEPHTAAAGREGEQRAATAPPPGTGPQELPPGPVPDDTPIASADEYPVDPTYRMRLPSGVVFLLRKPNVITMLSKGEIPNPLMNAVREIFDAEDKLDLEARAKEAGRTEEEQRAADLDEQLREAAERPAEPERPEEGLQFIDLIVFASVVAPEISADKPEQPGGTKTADGKLSLHAISDLDKMFISNWASGQLGLVSTFRQEREGADRERDGGTVRDDTEQPAGDPAAAEQPLA